MIAPLRASRVSGILGGALTITLVLAAAACSGRAPKPLVLHVAEYCVANDQARDIRSDPIEPYATPAAPAQSGKPDFTVRIDPGKTYQTIEGIGGAFNEIGGRALDALPPQRRQEVLRHLFDPRKGAGFSFCRLPIGASDFALDAYSYSQTPDDYTMSHFSIARDRKYLIPYAKAAQAINPKLKFYASPWSPPGWMKNSGRMDGDGPQNTLRDDARILKAYALYFCKYVQAYAAQGIPIDRVMIQNEPDVDPRYPGCVMSSAQIVEFAVKYLAPAFQARHVKAAIWGGTFREGLRGLPAHECMADPAFRRVIGGLGVQYSLTPALTDLHRRYPNTPLMHTEGDCFDGENSTAQGRTRLGELLGYLNAGCTTYIYWNMILDEKGQSSWDWPQNCLININRQTQAVTYNPDYPPLYLASRFLRPGVQRVAGESDLAPMGVFRRPDGAIIVLAQNLVGQAKDLRIELDQQTLDVSLPPNADIAIVIRGG